MNLASIPILMMGAATFIFTGIVQAQEAPHPSPPYLAPVPMRGHWTIKLKRVTSAHPLQDQSLPPDVPTKIEITTVNHAKRTTLTLGDGTTQDFDQEDGYLIFSSSAGLRVVSATERIFQSPFCSDGFLFAEWLRTAGISAFKETVTYRGILCFHYQNGSVDVWTDSNTGYPVAAKDKDIEADYEFLPPPSGPLIFPRQETDALLKAEVALKTLREVR